MSQIHAENNLFKIEYDNSLVPPHLLEEYQAALQQAVNNLPKSLDAVLAKYMEKVND